MKSIRHILTDFDGTIVDFGKHDISPTVRRAIDDCRQAGITITAVTGRPFEMAQPVLQDLGFEDPYVFDNGATIRNPQTGEVLWSRWLAAEKVRQVALALLPGAYTIDYAPVLAEHKPADDELALIGRIDQPSAAVFALLRLDAIDSTVQALRNISGINFYTAASTRPNDPTHLGVQITHEQASKFHGVTALRRLARALKAETMAIGDGNNDLPLFENAGFKIAMGNASDELKAAADHVVASYYDEGFAEAIYNYVLKSPETLLKPI